MEARADAILELLATPETRLQFSWYIGSYADFIALELVRPHTLEDAQLYMTMHSLNTWLCGFHYPVCCLCARFRQLSQMLSARHRHHLPAGDSVTANLTGYAGIHQLHPLAGQREPGLYICCRWHRADSQLCGPEQ